MFYSRVKNQTMKDTIDELKDAFALVSVQDGVMP